jgi:hypothetical protein
MAATGSGRARVSPTARDEHAAEAQPALPAAARLYEKDGGNDRQPTIVATIATTAPTPRPRIKRSERGLPPRAKAL